LILLRNLLKIRVVSVKVKFIAMAVCTGLVGFGVAAFLSNEWMYRAFKEHYKEEAFLIQTQIVDDLSAAMLSKSHEGIMKALAVHRRKKELKEIRVFDLKGREVFTEDKGLSEKRVKEALLSGEKTSFDKAINGENVTSYIIPLVNKPKCHACHGEREKLRGAVLLSISLGEMGQEIAAQRLKFFVLFAIVAIIFTIVAVLTVGKVFIRPLKRIQRGAEAIGKDNFEHQIPVTSQDEIGELAETFNQMSIRLRDAFESIKKSQEKIIHAEKLSSLGRLSAGLAHELKNPLTSIKMILQAAGNGSSPSGSGMTEEDVKVVLKEIKKLDTILTQFLTFAKPPQFQLKPMDLKETVEEVVSLMKAEFNQKAVAIISEMPQNLPKFHGCDKEIKQVLINLFLNSLQAMPEGGILRIMAHEVANNQRKEVHLKVEDSGEGIPEENRAKVFDPFFTTKEHGVGLGLSIIYGIIKEHHGTIDLQSQVGKGTIFTLAFPGEG
jgi:two-component system, NtrC family, sensor kinase